MAPASSDADDLVAGHRVHHDEPATAVPTAPPDLTTQRLDAVGSLEDLGLVALVNLPGDVAPLRVGLDLVACDGECGSCHGDAPFSWVGEARWDSGGVEPPRSARLPRCERERVSVLLQAPATEPATVRTCDGVCSALLP